MTLRVAESGAGRAEDTRQPWHASTPAASLSRAALALALLLGHEARITGEQWEDVRVMIQQRNYCIFKDCLALAIVGQSTCEEHQEIIFKPPTVTATPCPGCEAAARERDAAYEDSRQMQERLQRLIDAEPNTEKYLDRIDLLEKQLRAVRAQVETSVRDKAAAVGAAKRKLADLRERVEALAREMETDDRAGKLAHWIVSLRKIAGEGAK